MITLTVYPAHFGEPSASAFCVKSMCMLKMAGMKHEIVSTNDPRKAPKAKLPVLEMDGRVIADSDVIRDAIEAASGYDFDKGLSPDQRATSRAVIRMMEEHLYFAIVCDRWANDANWEIVKDAFFGDIPALFRGFVTRQVRKQALASLSGQGMGRHSEQERFERAQKDVDAVRDLLGDKPFLFGEKPTAADLSTAPMLRAAAAAPVATKLSQYINEDQCLTPYLNRAAKSFYP